MPIVEATKSFVTTVNGARVEVQKGDQRSAYDPVVKARKSDFKPLSEDGVRKSVEKARPDSDRRAA